MRDIIKPTRSAALWIRIGFNADTGPDQAFYLNPEPDPDPRAKAMRILADPDPGQTLKSQKVDFLLEKYT
jgi:hypothetical protein